MGRKVGTAVLWLLFVVVPVVAGAAGFFLSAKLTSSVAGLIVSAVLANALVAFGLSFVAFRGAETRIKRAAIATAIGTVLFGALGWALLFRRPKPIATTMPDRGVAFERIAVSTGSRLAVARLNEGASAVPIVFLHGGPGRPVSAGDVRFFRTVAEKGLDVVLFDQAGVGESDPLKRDEISLVRAVDDVEALRVALKLEKISIVGQSWGGRLGYEYAAKHREHVDRVAFIGAAPLRTDKAEWKFDERRTALAKGGRGAFPLGLFAALALNSMNPRASEAFASRDELNAMMAEVVPTMMKRSVCEKDGGNLPAFVPWGLDGTQFLAMRSFIEKVDAPPITSPPEALVLRPACDFTQWTTAADYRDRLHAKMIVVDGAGHALWPYRSEVARDVLAAFFRGEPLPSPTYDGATDPADR